MMSKGMPMTPLVNIWYIVTCTTNIDVVIREKMGPVKIALVLSPTVFLVIITLYPF